MGRPLEAAVPAAEDFDISPNKEYSPYFLFLTPYLKESEFHRITLKFTIDD